MSSDHADTRGLFPQMDLSRRGFVVTTLASGFALSVRPAKATVVTDSRGLIAGEVKIPVVDGQLPAYRAMPSLPGPHPVLLVIEEVFGVHEHIQDMCRRFAKLGYLAVAPELYSRLGDPGKLDDIREVMALVNLAPDQQMMSDLDQTVAWANALNGGDPTKVGITGWCRGGRTVWMYAAHNPHLQAGVAWYGPLSGKPDDQRPTNPLDVVDTIKVPMLGLYGAKDQSIPVSDVKEMEKRMNQAGEECKFVIYPDAGHAFNADYRDSYVADAAKDGFAQCVDWLRSHHDW